MLSSYTGGLCTLDLINLGIELETVTAGPPIIPNDPVHLKIGHFRVSVGTRVRSILAFSYGDRKCIQFFNGFTRKILYRLENLQKF